MVHVKTSAKKLVKVVPDVPDGKVVKVNDTMARCSVVYEIGFSPRGAAYLSGNIQTESGWIPNRPAWDDVGEPAGGLVSWRGQRLLQLQQEFYGRPVQLSDY